MTQIFRWEYERGGLYTKARHILIQSCLEADGLDPQDESLRHSSRSWWRAFEALPSPHDGRDPAIAAFWETNCHQKEFFRFGFTAAQCAHFFPFALRNALLRNGASLMIYETTYCCQGETQVIYPTLRAKRVKEIRWNSRDMKPSSVTSSIVSRMVLTPTKSSAQPSTEYRLIENCMKSVRSSQTIDGPAF